MLKAIIFDMDGVLIKSEEAISISFNKVLEKYGIKLDPKNKKKNLGRSLRDQLELIKEEHPQIPKKLSIQQFSEEAFKYQIKLLRKDLAPNVTMLSLFKKIKESNIKIAVATSSLRYRAKIFLELMGILNKLDTLVTSEDVARHKPYPDIFLETARRLNIFPKNCVVVEDAKNGIEGAKNAKMRTIGLVTKNHTMEELGCADMVINDLAELSIDKIKKLF